MAHNLNQSALIRAYEESNRELAHKLHLVQVYTRDDFALVRAEDLPALSSIEFQRLADRYHFTE